MEISQYFTGFFNQNKHYMYEFHFTCKTCTTIFTCNRKNLSFIELQCLEIITCLLLTYFENPLRVVSGKDGNKVCQRQELFKHSPVSFRNYAKEMCVQLLKLNNSVPIVVTESFSCANFSNFILLTTKPI